MIRIIFRRLSILSSIFILDGCSVRYSLPKISEHESLLVKVEKPWGTLLLKNRDTVFFRGNIELASKVLNKVILEYGYIVEKSEDNEEYFYKEIKNSGKTLEVYVTELGNKTVGVRLIGDQDLQGKIQKVMVILFETQGSKDAAHFDVSVIVEQKQEVLLYNLRNKLIFNGYSEDQSKLNNLHIFHNEDLIIEFSLKSIDVNKTKIDFIVHNNIKLKLRKEKLKGIIEVDKQKEFLYALLGEVYAT